MNDDISSSPNQLSQPQRSIHSEESSRAADEKSSVKHILEYSNVCGIHKFEADVSTGSIDEVCTPCKINSNTIDLSSWSLKRIYNISYPNQVQLIIFSANSLRDVLSLKISGLNYLKTVVFLSGCDYSIHDNEIVPLILLSSGNPLNITIEQCDSLEEIILEPRACIRGSAFRIKSLKSLKKLVLGKPSTDNSVDNLSLCLSLCRELRLFNQELPALSTIEVGNWSLSQCSRLYLPSSDCDLSRGAGALLHTDIQ